jgi:hypothetical protein
VGEVGKEIIMNIPLYLIDAFTDPSVDGFLAT